VYQLCPGTQKQELVWVLCRIGYIGHKKGGPVRSRITLRSHASEAVKYGLSSEQLAIRLVQLLAEKATRNGQTFSR